MQIIPLCIHDRRDFNDIRLYKSQDDPVEVLYEMIHAYIRHEAPRVYVFPSFFLLFLLPYLAVSIDFLSLFADFRLFASIVL